MCIRRDEESSFKWLLKASKGSRGATAIVIHNKVPVGVTSIQEDLKMCPLDLEGDGRKSQARAVVVKRRVFIKKEENEKAKLEKQKNELYMWGNVGNAD